MVSLKYSSITPLTEQKMSNNDLTDALNAVNFAHQVFQEPSSREEEELRHLLSAVRQRLQEMHAGRDEGPAPVNR
jgi:hypothetical protein